MRAEIMQKSNSAHHGSTWIAGALVAAALVTGSGHASGQSAADKAAAEALFEKGKELLAAGKIDDACGKFEGSQRLDAGLGTLLYLADCYEQAGRVASAWATFKEAESIAKSRNDKDREQVARQRASALEPRLSYLWIRVDPNAITDLEIQRNGTVIPRASWGVRLPVDPGEQVIEATAPGKQPFKRTVTIAGDHTTADITVPVLEDTPVTAEAMPPPATAAPEPAQPSATDSPGEDKGKTDTGLGTQRIAGIALGGAGVVGIAIGTVFALKADSKNDDSKEHCFEDRPNNCNQTGVDLREDAQSAATVATIAAGAGLAALAGGAVLYFTAPSHKRASAKRLDVVPDVGVGHAGLSIGGTW